MLVVEANPDAAEELRQCLVRHTFEAHAVGTGKEALAVAADFDLVVMALELPDLEGLEVCRRLRRDCDVPIIALSTRHTELDIVLGLQAGLDDYLAKPYGSRELIARIQTVIRRALPHSRSPHTLVRGALKLDLRTREVRVDERPVLVTRIEFDLLALLMSDPDAVFSRRAIMTKVWNDDWSDSSRTIDTHVGSLRRKLGGLDWVRTVRGVGFQIGFG